LTIVTEIKTRHPTRSAAQFAAARNSLLEASRRNAEAITAMGMVGRIAKHWHELNRNFVATSGRASDVGGGLGAASKVLRLLLQSAILAVGAWLVINQQSTPGIIIAGSILGARALAPVDLAIANWRGFVAARQSWQRLSRLLAHLPPKADPMPLKPPSRSLVVQNGAVTPPGVQKVVCQEVNFTLAAGKALGVIGPTASGKSSLARMLVGVWRPVRGNVRLDGATLDQWSSEALGRHIGYVPQDVELFNGTVAQNICRFEDPPDPNAVIAAAQAAGVHDLIINLPEGYDTVIGDHGGALSAGQAQRIALARALYRDPFLVVLDEPNSNLDAEGDEALTRAILGLRARGAITVVIAHRPSAIVGVDYILIMAKSRQQQFGPKEEVLSRVVQPASAPRSLKVAEQGGAG
jgi:ATP-binding cassette subfamily C protein